MKQLAIILVSASLAMGAVAADLHLDRVAPAKAPAAGTVPPADSEVIRQGGDTIADAVAIGLPYAGSGTTVGYTDDYDEVCPYSDSVAPDVVYTFTSEVDVAIEVDMYGSAYDTKIYIYNAALDLVACNDDYYSDYTSRLQGVPLVAGEVYYLVIDGYGAEAGDYTMTIEDFVPCELDIPAGAELEGEPPLVVDYVDCHNNGCQTMVCDGVPTQAFQILEGGSDGELVFHGRSGWYTVQGSSYRDDDWLIAFLGDAGILEVTVDATVPLYLFELVPTNCSGVGVAQSAIGGPCSPADLTVTGDPGQEVWLYTTPTVNTPPGWLDEDGDGVAEYDYVLWLSGLATGVVPTEAHSWSDIKALYR